MPNSAIQNGSQGMKEHVREVSQDDLPFLAIKAAGALDAIRKGRSSDGRDLKHFIDALKGHKVVPTASMKHLAPSDAYVMTRAVNAYSGREVKTVEDLKRELQKLYSEAKTPLQKTTAEQLMKFCIAFHDEFLDQKRILVSSRRSRSPFRV
jgi:hypothetical protein